MDKFKIDSHKLFYHPERVSNWLKGKEIYPIYLEISPSGACNHRCIFCALDFLGYKTQFIDSAILKKQILEMSHLGVKSILYGGEGEPLLHKDIKTIIQYTKKAGIDTALTTNGALLGKDLSDAILASLTWLKISISAATEGTYAKIHQASPKDFNRVINNLDYIIRLRKLNGYKCTVGAQILLLPENYKEVLSLAKKVKNIGLDYLVVKPYSQHHYSKTKIYKNIRYDKYLFLAEELKKFNDSNFNIIFRTQAMVKWDNDCRIYKHCYALPFWSYIDSYGFVWACSAYLGNRKFIYGNIYKNNFKNIWQGKNKKRIEKFAANKLNAIDCRVNCRMDEINRYLWELKHPKDHVNFI